MNNNNSNNNDDDDNNNNNIIIIIIIIIIKISKIIRKIKLTIKWQNQNNNTNETTIATTTAIEIIKYGNRILKSLFKKSPSINIIRILL